MSAGRDPELIWTEDGQPQSGRFDDVYFSRTSGIDESLYVFCQHNGLTERWRRLKAGDAFTVGETGFGTGLNFLVAWQQWRQLAPPDARLHFVSLEKYPLNRRQLRQALNLWPRLTALSDMLLGAYPPMPASGFHRLIFDEGRIQLTLIFADVVEGLTQLLPVGGAGPTVASVEPGWTRRSACVDAWFLDGFAPAKNPEMWQPEVFRLLARLSRVGTTTFATFTAAGAVREALKHAGFTVHKMKGFGRKRHMLCGELRDTLPSPIGSEPSWHLMPRAHTSHPPRTVLVIGAGLAGCHTARALAERGLKVQVVEKSTVASGASGNAQGVVYAKASSQDQPLTTFNLAALQFACRYYSMRAAFDKFGAASGVVHLAQTPKQEQEYQALAARYVSEPEFVRWLSVEEAEAACGVPLFWGGLLFSQAGWLNPGEVCRSLLEHRNIAVREQVTVGDLQRHADEWVAFDTDGNRLAQADAVVIANAAEAQQLPQTAHFPVKAIRGQVTQVPASPSSTRLTRVLCGKGYIAPAHAGEHCVGATFNLDSHERSANPADDQHNLAQVAELSPALAGWAQATAARVGFRCATPDYMPLAGPAPIAAQFHERFAALRHNARAAIDATGCFYPELFVNLGHGSRGLAYTPLCAELVAAMICGDPLPLQRDMVLRLHPGRFLIRDLQRNRPAKAKPTAQR